MNAREANVFLTKAAMLDPRMKRLDPAEQADMASMWAEVLEDVSLGDALEAVRVHYRSSGLAITPADVVRLAQVEEPSPWKDITAEIVAESKARALEAAGVTEAEYEAHKDDAAWVRAKFETLEVTE